MSSYIKRLVRLFAERQHTDEVRNDFHLWLADDSFRDEKDEAMTDLWMETSAQPGEDTFKSLSKLNGRLGNKSRRPSLPAVRTRVFRYAACLIFFICSVGATFYLTKREYSETAMLENYSENGHINVFELPDGSVVKTNSQTHLFYPESFKGETRTVYLIGEADFKVKKDSKHPFIVKSGPMQVTALGTEFNVCAYPQNENLVATLLSGKVLVECAGDNSSYILHPGQGIVYSRTSGTSQLVDSDLDDVTAWQKGLYTFRGKSLEEILLTLERYYPVKFVYNESLLGQDRFNFRFRRDSELDDVLSVISEVVGNFSYSIEDDVCYLRAKKRNR